MKKILFLSACLLAVMACEKKAVTPETGPQQDLQQQPVRIVPVMTKATQTAFEQGDAIGVTITRSEGAYATNEKMVFDGSVFSGSLKWYAEGTEGATVAAYYPYAATVPASFTVQADQSAGVSASDFIAGIKEGVLPSAHAVTVPFKHKLSLLVLNVINNSQGEPTAIAMEGAKLTAKIAADFTATVDEEAAPGSVVAAKVSEGKYVLVVPPQTVSLVATVTTAGGNKLSQALQEATLEAGKQYSISMIVNPDNLVVALSGDIENWLDGGEIGPGDPPAGDLVENLSDGYITYHGDQYTVAKMDDGKWWMTQNMRYVPEGFTPSSDLTAVTAGIFYPLKINDGKTAAEFDTSEEKITAAGYLYQAECALGLKVGDLTTVEGAQALEGAQGICPQGWHVPTSADIQNLVGKVAGLTTIATPYNPNAGDCYIQDLNADNFNMEAFGAISIQDNTKTAGTFMGFMSAYTDHLSSGMFCGSSYATVTYNTKDDPTSGVKNLQFYGLMPMTNKATEAEYTCNGTKVSYRIAGPLRCVRNE
jgi:uncharacterized protein (TIGR02145 family)